MSATTATRPASERDALQRAAAHRAVRGGQRAIVRPFLVAGAWYWAIYLIVVTSVILGIHRWGDGLTRGIFDLQWGGSMRWFVFVLGLIVPAASLGMHVAGGGTRRSLVTATVRSAALIGLVFGLVTGAYLLGERALFAALDMPWTRDSGLPVDGLGGIAASTASEALVVMVYLLAGALLAAGYYRFGTGRGTAFILVSLVPVALIDLATRTGGTAAIFGDRYPFDGATAVAVGLAAGAFVAWLSARLLQTVVGGIQLRPPA